MRGLSAQTRLRAAGALVASAALLTAAACGSSSKGGTTNGGGSSAANETLTRGGTLNITSQSDVGNLDTSQAYEVVAWTILRTVTRQLVSYAGDPRALTYDTDPKPDLATYTVSDDKKTYTFKLKSGVAYSGPTSRAITSKDFVYALKRLCDPNGASGAIGYYTGTIAGMKSFCDGFGKIKTGDVNAVKSYIDGHEISGLKTPDDQTLIIQLMAPAGDFLNIMALPFATPEPEEILSKYLTDTPEMRQHFVSSGPYYIKAYVPDKSYDIERAPNFQAATDDLRHAYVDSIKVDLTAGDDATEFQQIQAGTSDLSLDVTTPPSAVVQRLKSTNDPTLRTSVEGRVDYVPFNLRAGNTSACGQALKKLAVRQAFNYAFNKQSIVQVKGGTVFATPTGQVMTQAITGYKKIDPYATPNSEGDPAKAKQMLAAAGYPNGLTCTLLYRDKNKGKDIALAVQQDMAKAGITLKLNQTAKSDYYAKHLQKPSVNDWDLTAGSGWSPDWQGNAGRSFFVPLLDGKASPCEDGTTNYGCYNDDALNATIDKALAASDPSALWAQADALVMADAPWIPMVEEHAVTVSSKRLKGFRWFSFADNADWANVAVL
jgi:peptide/nickel transport system substrate-binding protein